MNFNVSREKLVKLYKDVKKETGNFQSFKPEVLSKNCQRVIVFRLLLGYSVESFAKKCSRTHGSIQNLERKQKFIDMYTASHYMKIIENEFSKKKIKISLQIVLSIYDKFSMRSEKGIKLLSKKEIKKFALKGAKFSVDLRKISKEAYYKPSYAGIKVHPMTKQEMMVTSLLTRSGINFVPHFYVRRENVDIALPSIKTYINCRSVRKTKNLLKHCRDMMYRAYRIKYHDPNSIFIAVIGNGKENLKKKELSIGCVDTLNEICDRWFVDENINELISYLQKLTLSN